MAKRKNDKTKDNLNEQTGNKTENKNISEENFKMPSASGDRKSTAGGEKKKSEKLQPKNTKKLPQREEPAFSGQNEGDFSPSGVTGSNENSANSSETGKKKKSATAIVKSPAKITQAAKGRFETEEDQNTGDSGKGEKIGALNGDKKKPLPKPKKDLPKTGAKATTSKADKKISAPGKAVKSKKTDEPVEKKSKISDKKSTRSSKASGTEKSSEKISAGPEIKGGNKKTSRKQTSKETGSTKDTSITDDLTGLAKAAAMKIAGKVLPDEKTRDQIAKTAKDMLPDREDIQKTAKDLKEKFSPEKEQNDKAVEKEVPSEQISKKTEKAKRTAKSVKTRDQKKAGKKGSKEFSLISEFDVHLFREGKHYHLYKKLGSHPMEFNGINGVYFALWAPNARNVSVIGDFNNWYKQANPMNSRHDESGIWEVFIPEAKQGSIYKYFIQSTTGYEAEKGDPYAFMWEVPPNTASVVWDLESSWNDEKWLTKRKKNAGKAKPVSVYEMHVGSWKRVPEEGNRSLSYRELAKELPQYLNEMGFTHVEFMPVMEHPFFGSWGYQVTGYFAPSSRFGNPQDFMHLIDSLHQAGIGVILDWVPSHFPSDLHGLHYYDGTFLYEHEDPQKGFHPDWKSYIFNFGRNEVRSFLISNALFWLDKFHADGLRVDAVASMLYLDYSRNDGEWQPNEHGGNENLEAISFLKEFNEVVYSEFPDTITIAEESTAWPMVSKPTYMGGLGFGMKWMMGWMHDTLDYFQKDPIHRRHHQNTITFSTNYAFTENFMLPLSHDEVVYGKQALWKKMPGDDWNKFANLRSLYAYMFAHPGTKLLFMGAEFAQTTEWGHDSSLDWHVTGEEPHKKIQHTLSALNRLYKEEPALYERSFEPEGFEWIDFNDAESSVMSFLRKGNDSKDDILVVCNFTPVPRENYRIGVSAKGNWAEIFNSDDDQFGGSNIKNENAIKTEHVPTHQKKQSLSLTLPPMGVVYFKRVQS